MGKPTYLRPFAKSAILASMLALALVVSALAVTAEDFPPTIYVTIDEADQFQMVEVSYGQVSILVRGLVEVEKESIKPETIKVTIEGTPWDGSVNTITETVTGARDSFDFTLRLSVPGTGVRPPQRR